MKSKIKGLEVCIINKRSFITGYHVEILDDFPNEILQQLQPSVTSKFIQPVQLATLLEQCEDTRSGDNQYFDHRFIWYQYNKTVYYPNLAINGVLALRYNIPVTVINTDTMADESSKQAWINYVSQLQEIFYKYYNHTVQDPKNIGDYTYSITVAYNALPDYIKCDTQPSPTAIPTPVQSWGDSHLEEVKLREQQLKEEEENRKEQTKLVPPPFDYDVNAKRLAIPRKLESINYPLVKHMLQAIQNSYGVNFDAELVKQYRSTKSGSFNAIKNKLMSIYGCDFLNFNARKCNEDHYAFQLCKYLGINPAIYKSGTGYMSFTKDNLEKFIEEYTEKVKNGEATQEQLDIIKMNQQAYEHNTSLKLINEIFQGLGDTTGKCEYLADKGLLQFHCTIAESETKRFTTQSPNVQGKSSDIKQMIKGRDKNRKVVAIDIKAQEVAIMVFGVLENKELQRLSLLYGDCYKAFADIIGEEYSPEMKNIIKVPILSIMNGKSDQTIRMEMLQHLTIVEKIFHVIFDDPGYKRILEIAKIESKKAKPIRRGLFGTEVEATKGGKYGNDAGTKRRQSLNGNFQLTASEIVTSCLHAFIYDLMTGRNKYGLTLEQLTPICTIYDEVLFDVDNEVLDEAKELIQFYMLPVVQGWAEMSGEITEGEYYVHK